MTNLAVVVVSMNVTSKEIISSNSSFVEVPSPISTTTSILSEEEDVPESCETIAGFRVEGLDRLKQAELL